MNGRQRTTELTNGNRHDGLPLMPITMMFASDVIGVPYRQYAVDHTKLVEGQLRTAERFGFDYVSVISDPAREAADCGATIYYPDDAPPAIDEAGALLADPAALATLRAPDPMAHGSRMRDRVDAVEQLRRRVGDDLLVEGWIEGPCAQAADLRGINSLMMDFIDDPAFVNDLLDFIVDMELTFAVAQVKAGAHLVGIGDAAASLIGPTIYEQFIRRRQQKLVDGIHGLGAAVRLHICGNTQPLLEGIGTLGCDIVDLDSMVSMAEARRAVGGDTALLGNIDPVGVLRNGEPAVILDALAKCAAAAGRPYVVGAGCEIPRDTPHANVHAMAGFALADRS